MVRLSVKAANLMTRNYVPYGPAAVFVASAAHARARRPAPPRLADDRARSRRSSHDHQVSPPPAWPGSRKRATKVLELSAAERSAFAAAVAPVVDAERARLDPGVLALLDPKA